MYAMRVSRQKHEALIEQKTQNIMAYSNNGQIFLYEPHLWDPHENRNLDHIM